MTSDRGGPPCWGFGPVTPRAARRVFVGQGECGRSPCAPARSGVSALDDLLAVDSRDAAPGGDGSYRDRSIWTDKERSGYFRLRARYCSLPREDGMSADGADHDRASMFAIYAQVGQSRAVDDFQLRLLALLPWQRERESWCFSAATAPLRSLACQWECSE